MLINPRLRMFGYIPAGFPSPAQGYEDEPLDLHDLLVKRPAATFFFRATGDALYSEGIRDGSILVVDRSLTPRRGRLVVADVEGERVVCRYPPAGEDVQVWGVVTAAVVRF